MVPLAVADEVILVVNPELSSIVDALKTKILTEVVGGHVLGTIINRVDKEKSEILSRKMEKVLGVKVIGIIPEDANVRRAAAARSPLSLNFRIHLHQKRYRGSHQISSGSPIKKTWQKSQGKGLSSASQKHSSKRNPTSSTAVRTNFYRFLFRCFNKLAIGMMPGTRCIPIRIASDPQRRRCSWVQVLLKEGGATVMHGDGPYKNRLIQTCW